MTTATQRFIEKAIEGGWLIEHPYEYGTVGFIQEVRRALLDPEAWRAVGKVEEWGEQWDVSEYIPGWHRYMLDMIDALASGKSIEEYLNEIV